MFRAATQAAMLALNAQVGDYANRLDSSATLQLNSLPASTLGNWAAVTGSFVLPVDSDDESTFTAQLPQVIANERALAAAATAALIATQHTTDAAAFAAIAEPVALAAQATANATIKGTPPNPTVIRSATRIFEPTGNVSFAFPARSRPLEVARRLVRVRNNGANSITVAYGSGQSFTKPGSTVATVPVGQEWVDGSGNPNPVFLAPAVTTNSWAATIYVELGAS